MGWRGAELVVVVPGTSFSPSDSWLSFSWWSAALLSSDSDLLAGGGCCLLLLLLLVAVGDAIESPAPVTGAVGAVVVEGLEMAVVVVVAAVVDEGSDGAFPDNASLGDGRSGGDVDGGGGLVLVVVVVLGVVLVVVGEVTLSCEALMECSSSLLGVG